MATIFDGFRNATDAYIAHQIALLETITFGKVLKPYKDKMKKGTVTAIKKIGNIFGSDLNLKYPEVKEVYDILEENVERLRELSREDLDEKLRNILCARVKCKENDTDEFISTIIVDEASSLFDINEFLTPAQKSDIIYKNFNDMLLDKSETQVENFTDELLKNLVGTGFWKMFSSLKSIEQKMLAESVWFAVGSYGGSFTPKNEELPSWVPAEKQEAFEDGLKEFMNLMKEVENASFKVKEKEEEIKKLESTLLEKEDNLKYQKFRRLNAEEMEKYFKNKYSTLEKEIVYFSQKGEELKEFRKSVSNENEELKKELDLDIKKASESLQNKVKDLEIVEDKIENNINIIEDSSKKIKEYENNINEMNEMARQLNVENTKLQETEEALKNSFNKAEANRCKLLQQVWSSAFIKFQINLDILRQVSKLNLKERLQIEKALLELHDARDPECISITEEKSDVEYFEIILNEDEIGCIEYEANKTGSGHILLLRFYKKDKE